MATAHGNASTRWEQSLPLLKLLKLPTVRVSELGWLPRRGKGTLPKSTPLYLLVQASSAWVSPPYPPPTHPALLPRLLNLGNWNPVQGAGQHHSPPCFVFLSVLESSLAELFLHPTYQAKQTWSRVKERRVSWKVWTSAGRVQITLLNACLCFSLNPELYKDRDCLYFGSLALNIMLK